VEKGGEKEGLKREKAALQKEGIQGRAFLDRRKGIGEGELKANIVVMV